MEVLKVLDNEDFDGRHAGCGAVVGDELYLWGGETSEEVCSSEDSSDSSGEELEKLYDPVTLPRATDKKHQFDVFNLISLTWSRQVTLGELNKEVPNIGNGSTLSYHRDAHSLYLYGGWNKENFSSDVYCVSMDTWKWEKVPIPKGDIKPSPRYLTGVLVHGDQLCNFGGVGGDICKNQDIGAKYRMYKAHGRDYPFGWNNEYYEFDVHKRKWKAPMSGNMNRPPPVGGHVFTKFDSYRAIYYGGRREDGRSDVTYIFDLNRKEFELLDQLDTRPIHRTFTTLCPLIDPEVVGQSLCPGGPPMEQNLLLLWGKEEDELIVDDCWFFSVKDMKWTKVDTGQIGRYWHIGCPYYCQPGRSTEGQVVVYGGCKHDTTSLAVKFLGLRDLTIFSFGIKSLKKLCISEGCICLDAA